MARRSNDEDEDAGSGGGEELSHRKKDRSEGGGGLADDIDCVIVSARVSMRSKINYQDADPEGAACLMVKYSSEVEGFETFTEYYSMGKNVVPGDKGKRMMRAPGSKGDFNASTKAARFLDSLGDSGLAEDDMYPYDKLDGLAVHVNRKADEKREGLEDNGNNKKRSILIVTDLLDEETPKTGKGSGKKKAAAKDEDADEDEDPKPKTRGKKPAADADADEDADDDADDEKAAPAASKALVAKAVKIVAKVAKAGPHDDVADVYQAAFRALKGDDDRAAIIRDLLNEDDLPAFLKKHADAGGWTFAKGKLSEAE